jgi:hypothetical protein
MKRNLSVLFLMLLSACQVLNRPDVPATLQAQNDGYIIEATMLAGTSQANQTTIEATSMAVGTLVADQNSINLQMLATIRAVIPPTPGRIVGNADGSVPGFIPAGPGDTGALITGDGATTPVPTTIQFTNIGVASAVRRADGCAVSLLTQFPANTQRIYVTARALNIRAGTLMAVEWRRENQVVVQENWTVPQDATNFCLWFNMDSAAVQFTPGQWSVRLFANNQPIDPEVTFTIG